MKISEREIEHIAILGFGRTGRAVLDYSLAHGVSAFVSDNARLGAEEKEFLASHAVPYEEGEHTNRAIERAELIVLSPGIPSETPLLAEAVTAGIPIISELDLAFHLAPPVPLVAVTGTNGKSTTVALIEAILQHSSIRAIAAGNIGTPFISLVDSASAYDAVILEVSSFQLEQSVAFHPRVAVILNIAPDHLERHNTMDAYIEAKARLFQKQDKNDWAIVPEDLESLFPGISAQKVLFDRLDLPLSPFLASLSPHNRANLRAAIAACVCLFPEFDPTKIELHQTTEAFRLPFRMHEEPRIHGIRLVNDSKSTNAASAIAALASIGGTTILILGGRHKGAGYESLAQAINAHRVKHVVLFGSAAPLLRGTLCNAKYKEISDCTTLDQALTLALRFAQEGDTILFSPACSSYDQYGNYIERGEHFSRLVATFSN